MAFSKETLEDTEFAKSHLLQSNLDDKCKKSLLRLLNMSLTATNGLSLDDKVQALSETIVGLVASQITFLDSVDKKIETANREQCKTCKAMKHASEVEEQKKREEIIAAWKDAHGIKDSKDGKDSKDSKDDVHSMSLLDVAKTVLVKPYAWVFGSIAVFSPYSLDILNAVLSFFSK